MTDQQRKIKQIESKVEAKISVKKHGFVLFKVMQFVFIAIEAKRE